MSRHATMTLLAAVLCAGAAHAAGAQADPRLDSLARDAARHVTRFADRRVAVSEGYRRIGTDFPGMGEHWLHPGVLMSGRVDAEHPTVLVYAAIAGRPALLGAGFVALARGDSALDVPGWPGAWHEHSGLLADESGAAPRGATSETPVRVWVLHVWTALENPSGPYAPDNWALPFARAGIRVAGDVDADVGRGASLAVGGDAYLRDVLTDAGLRDDATAAAVDSLIGRAAERASATFVAMRRDGVARQGELDALGEVWRTMAASLRGALGPRVDPMLAPPHQGVGAAHHSHGGRDP